MLRERQLGASKERGRGRMVKKLLCDKEGVANSPPCTLKQLQAPPLQSPKVRLVAHVWLSWHPKGVPPLPLPPAQQLVDEALASLRPHDKPVRCKDLSPRPALAAGAGFGPQQGEITVIVHLEPQRSLSRADTGSGLF